MGRVRGAQAYERLVGYLEENGKVELELRCNMRPTLSFLDELVRQLQVAGYLDRVVFVIKDSDTLRKLSRIAEVRKARLTYRHVGASTQAVVSPMPGPARRVVVGRRPASETMGFP